MRLAAAIIAAILTIAGVLFATQLPQPVVYPDVKCATVQTTIAGDEVWIQRCTTYWVNATRGSVFIGAMGIFFLALGGAILVLLIARGIYHHHDGANQPINRE